jgi:hypothetical protein
MTRRNAEECNRRLRRQRYKISRLPSLLRAAVPEFESHAIRKGTTLVGNRLLILVLQGHGARAERGYIGYDMKETTLEVVVRLDLVASEDRLEYVK